MVNRVAYHTLRRDIASGSYSLDGVLFTGRAYRGDARWPDSEQEYLNGVPHGLKRAWHPNGALVQQLQYLNDQLHGVREEWNGLGQMLLLEFWELGITLFRQRWNDAGDPIETYQISTTGTDAHLLAERRKGLLRQQHQQRELGAASAWRSLLPERVDRHNIDYPGHDGLYYEDEQPFSGWAYTGSAEFPNSEQEFLNGLRWGLSRDWYRDGALMEQTQWLDDVLHGLAQAWDKAGNLILLECCELGCVLWSQNWGEQGSRTEEYHLDAAENNLQSLKTFRAAHLRYHQQHRQG